MEKREVLKFIEAVRKVFHVGGERRSRALVIPNEWFKRLEEMDLPSPKKMRWLLDHVGFTIPEVMRDTEGLKHLFVLLYAYFPAEFVDEVFERVKEEIVGENLKNQEEKLIDHHQNPAGSEVGDTRLHPERPIGQVT